MDGTEIGSDKTAEEAATYVDPINQKTPIKNFKNSLVSFVIISYFKTFHLKIEDKILIFIARIKDKISIARKLCLVFFSRFYRI